MVNAPTLADGTEAFSTCMRKANVPVGGAAVADVSCLSAVPPASREKSSSFRYSLDELTNVMSRVRPFRLTCPVRWLLLKKTPEAEVEDRPALPPEKSQAPP